MSTASTGQTPEDFAIAHTFKIEIDGIGASYFHEAAGLNVHVDMTEVQEGGKNDGTWKVPGSTRYENIVLKRGVTNSKDFFQWCDKSVKRQIERKSGSISLMDRKQQEIMRWNLKKAWCCRYEGPTLNSLGGTQLAIEAVEIAHEGIEIA